VPIEVVAPLISQVCRESRFFALNHLNSLNFVQIPQGLGMVRNTILPFNKKTDMLRLSPVLDWPKRSKEWVETLDISSDLQALLNDTNVPLCISYEILEHPLFHKSSERKLKSEGKTSLLQWVLQYISQRTEVMVSLGQLSVDLDHKEACDCGLFGLFAESTPAHIDIENLKQGQNSKQREKLEEIFNHHRYCKCWEADFVKYLHTGNLQKRMENFRRRIRKQSVRPLPRFRFVLEVSLEKCDYDCYCEI
jgi:hypothetical protein